MKQFKTSELEEVLKTLEVISLKDRTKGVLDQIAMFLNNKYKSTVIFNESKESFTIILADGEEQEIREELNEILNV